MAASVTGPVLVLAVRTRVLAWDKTHMQEHGSDGLGLVKAPPEHRVCSVRFLSQPKISKGSVSVSA